MLFLTFFDFKITAATTASLARYRSKLDN